MTISFPADWATIRRNAEQDARAEARWDAAHPFECGQCWKRVESVDGEGLCPPCVEENREEMGR